jgi:hypothetical protein
MDYTEARAIKTIMELTLGSFLIGLKGRTRKTAGNE